MELQVQATLEAAAQQLEKAVRRHNTIQAEANSVMAEVKALQQLIEALELVKQTERNAGFAVDQEALGLDLKPHRWDGGGTVIAGHVHKPVEAEPAPNSNDRVLWILRKTPDEDVELDAVREIFTRRGWNDDSKAPDAMVYAALKRVANGDNNVVRTSRTTWRWTSDPGSVRDWDARERLRAAAVANEAARAAFGPVSDIPEGATAGAP